jgi:signal transduction histidine kinase
MKYIFLAINLLFSFQLSAQDQDIELQSKIDFFNLKIEQTEKGERLRWMDSLTTTIYDNNFYYNPKFKYDSIAKQTITYAIDLDSVSKAAEHVANLIWYKNAIARKPSEGKLLFNTYINDFKTIDNSHTLARLYLYLGESYKMTGNLDKALECYIKVKAYSLKSGNDNYLGRAHLYVGNQQGRRGEFSEASLSYKSAIGLFIKIKDTFGIISTKHALANLYSKNVFPEEAIKERDETIELSKKFSKSSNLPLFYSNISQDYNQLGNRVKQIEYLKLSLHALENKSKDRYWSIDKIKTLADLSNAYVDSDSLGLAEQNFKVLEVLYVKDKNSRSSRDYVNAKKTLTYAKGNYKESLRYSNVYLEIQKERKDIVGIMNAEKSLAEVYKALGDTSNSSMHLLNHYQIKDSISSVQNVKSLAYYQTLYETEKRDLKIKNQNASIGLLNLENKNKTQVLIFGSLGLLMLFGGIVVYRSFRSAKKREQAQQTFSQELISTQEKERTRIAKDLHDGVGQQITLLKIKAQNTNQTELSGLAHNALEEVRSISRGLYPVTLAKLGLTDSIEQLLLELDEETDLFVSVEIDDVNTNFNETESLNFYRFIQESVNNVLKHANAKMLIVNIVKQTEGIKILIKDNGEGFEVSDKINQNSLGLKTMAERITMLKGSFAIRSKRAEGTSILVQIPL